MAGRRTKIEPVDRLGKSSHRQVCLIPDCWGFQGIGTRFGRPPSDPKVIEDKLSIVAHARAAGNTAAQAAELVG